MRNIRGYSVMELVVVMGVIGAALATAMIYQGKISAQNKANSFVTAFQDMTDKIKASYASNPSGYAGINATTVGNMKLNSSPIRFNGTNLFTPFTLSGIGVSGDADNFYMQFEVDQENCVTVGSKIGAFAKNSYVWNGAWVQYQFADGSWNMSTLTTGCASMGTPQLLFAFGKY